MDLAWKKNIIDNRHLGVAQARRNLRTQLNVPRNKLPTESAVRRLIKKYEEEGTLPDRRCSYGPTPAGDDTEMIKKKKANVEKVKHAVEENPQASLSKISEATDVSKSVVWSILRHDLKLKAYKRVTAQKLEPVQWRRPC